MELFIREEICSKKIKIYNQQKHYTKKTMYADDKHQVINKSKHCMYVCTVCTHSMYVCMIVCMIVHVCMYSMYVQYVCMYVQYVCMYVCMYCSKFKLFSTYIQHM